VLGLLALAALWRWTPLSAVLHPVDLAALAAPLRAWPLGPPLAVLGFALAAALLFPLTVLVVASALVYGPWLGFAVSLAGSFASALIGFCVGRVLWRDALHRLMTPRLRRLSGYVAAQRIRAVAAVRILPVAPFGAVNLAAGASRLRLRDFALGTLFAMAPGLLAMSALADRFKRVVFDPGWGSALVLVALTLALLAARSWVHRRISRRRRAAPPGPSRRPCAGADRAAGRGSRCPPP
jgi:uncharacterized membrane protein YdjX (TVP38/TMEM64 family)